IDSQAIIFLVEGDNENNVVNKIPVLLNVENGPKTYKEAITSRNSAFWKEAIDDEMDSLVSNNIRELSDLPPGSKAIGCRWVFRIKYHTYGSIQTFKARLVIQSFRQRQRVDYFDTYAPVARITSIRVLFALALIYNLPIHQMNVKTAFLNGDLDEEFYMKQPEGFVLPGHKNKVCKLKKSLYRLKQAPKQWHDKYDKSILSNSFTHNSSDRYIYSKFTKDYGVILCLYVDDILIVGTNMEGINETKMFLSSCFQMKDMNEDHWKAIGRVFGYPKRTRQLALYYDRFLAVLEEYSDASWITGSSDSKSTTGWIFTLGGGAICWGSKKQTCITHSTMKAEFLALVAAGKEAKWLRNMLLYIELWPQPMSAISLHYDSQSTLSRAYNKVKWIENGTKTGIYGFIEIKSAYYSISRQSREKSPSMPWKRTQENESNVKKDTWELSTGWIMLIFLSIRYKEYLEKSPDAITTVLPIEEPEYSLSMGYEHLSTIWKTKYDEVIESSAKNLLPIPSEYEVTIDDESECDVPVKDESSLVFTTFSNPLFDDNDDFTSSDDESLPDEDVPIEEFKVYSNPLFDDEEFNFDKLDPHCFNAESDFVESLSNRDTLIDSSPKFDYLEEFSGALMPTSIANEERIRREHAYDSQREEIDIFTVTDLLPPSIKSDDYDSKGDIHVLQELLVDDSISLPENESFYFDHQDDSSFPRPPPEPPDVEIFFEPDSGVLTTNVVKDRQEKDKIGSKPDKNGKRGEARKSQKQLQDTSQISSIHAIAPILSTKESEHLLSMGYEHLSITPGTESDEVTDSNAENLLPIPSECEVTLEDKRECDLPIYENIHICDHSDTFFDSKIDDDILVYDDDFEDIDITRLISNIEYLNDNPTLNRMLNSFESDNSLSDNFSPEFETFCDHSEETRSGNITHADNSLPEYDSFCFEIKTDQERLINLVKNNIPDDLSNDSLLEEADLFLASDNSIPPGIE
nr:zinc finger, CCHC-type [Tanacetum cinerariifolium]